MRVKANPASAASSVAAHNAAVMRPTGQAWAAARSGGPAAFWSSVLAGTAVSFHARRRDVVYRYPAMPRTSGSSGACKPP